MVMGNLALEEHHKSETHKEEAWAYFNQIVKDIPDIYDVSFCDEDMTVKNVIDFNKINIEAREFVKFWIQKGVYRKHKAAKTLEGEFNIVKNFLNYFEEQYSIRNPLDVLGYHYELHLKRYVKLVKSEVYEMSSANAIVTIIEDFFKVLDDNNIMDASFIYEYRALKRVPRGKPEFYFKGKQLEDYIARKKDNHNFYKYEDLQKIIWNLDILNNALHRKAIFILAHTGLRITELLNLELDCCEVEILNRKHIYWLSNYKTIKTKGRHWTFGQPLRISMDVYNAIKESIKLTCELREEAIDANEGYEKKIFLNYNQDKNHVVILQAGSLTFSLKRMAKYCKIEKATLHMFRHTFAKMLYDKGVPIEYIRKYLNHYEENMTSSYINHSKDEIVQKYKNFAQIKHFEGGAKESAENFRDKIMDVVENVDFQGMAVESQAELLEMISSDSHMHISVMNHGICFIPETTKCPNNYTDINSCIEEHCNNFATTEASISMLEKAVKAKTKFVWELKSQGHEKAFIRNKARLDKTKAILNGLKER